MDLLTYIVFLLITGLVIGAIARLMVPATGGMGIMPTILAGIGGSFIAGLISWYLLDPRNDWVGIVLAVICAAVLVAIFRPRRTLV